MMILRTILGALANGIPFDLFLFENKAVARLICFYDLI